MLKYASLIVDIRNSREYIQTERNEIQWYIKECISCLNYIFHESVKFDMVFSGGDEIQGLFKSPEAAYLYFRLFNMLVSPVQVRAGLGVGEWNIITDSKISTEQDGPVYHNARYAIENVDDKLGYELLFYSEQRKDLYINSQINTATILTHKQSEYQNQLQLLTELMYPIINEGSYDPDSLYKLKNIIRMKNGLSFYTKWNAIRKKPPKPFFEEEVNLIEPIHVYDETPGKYFFESAGKVRGAATRLAAITNTARQTVERSLKAGNVFEIRNACITVLKLMKNY